MSTDRENPTSADVNDVLNPHRGDEQREPESTPPRSWRIAVSCCPEMKTMMSWPIFGRRSSDSSRSWRLAVVIR